MKKLCLSMDFQLFDFLAGYHLFNSFKKIIGRHPNNSKIKANTPLTLECVLFYVTTTTSLFRITQKIAIIIALTERVIGWKGNRKFENIKNSVGACFIALLQTVSPNDHATIKKLLMRLCEGCG